VTSALEGTAANEGIGRADGFLLLLDLLLFLFLFFLLFFVIFRFVLQQEHKKHPLVFL
jgi:hypothetical protein